MGGVLMQHHQIPLPKTAFPRSSALRTDGARPRLGFRRLCSLTVVGAEDDGDGDGDASPRRNAVKRHSREELIAFFGDIQASIVMESPGASRRRTRRASPADPFEEVARRKMSPEEQGRDELQLQPMALELEDMKVAELRELARSRRVRGYSKLKKAELVDRLKGASL